MKQPDTTTPTESVTEEVNALPMWVFVTLYPSMRSGWSLAQPVRIEPVSAEPEESERAP